MSNVAQAVIEQQRKRAEMSSYEPTDLTKYFTIALEKGVARGEKTIRLLPDPIDPDASPFVEVYFHVFPVGGKMRKLYDPDKNEQKPSPLSEIYRKFKNSTDPATKEAAKKYRPRLFYIIRCIERGKEHEGVKFWRFPHDAKGAGVFDMMTDLFQKYGDIINPDTGLDLNIKLTKVKGKGNTEYTDITSILPNPTSVLSDDLNLKAQWLADKSTWESVYKKYDHDYLMLVAEDETPTWSEALNKWVAKGEPDQTTSASTGEDMASAVNENSEVQAELPVSEEEIVVQPDDLPF